MLTIEQIKEKLRSPVKKEVIQEAINHQKRIRLHSQISLNEVEAGEALIDFYTFVKAGTEMPEDKFNSFVGLTRFPLKTIKITDKVYDSLGKVFEGQNPVFKYDFTSTKYLDDYHAFLTEEQFANKWRTEGIEAMRNSINSVLVVDAPMVQQGSRPKPYFYFLDICHVIDFLDGKDSFDHLLFMQEKETLVVIDDVSYRIFDYKGDPDKIELISEAPHPFGYCPCKFFWSESISSDKPDLKKSRITSHLGDLDWALYFLTAKQHLDSYAGYPIYSAFETDCDYEEDTATGFVRCDHGFLKDTNGDYIHYGSSIARCPVCSTKRLRGPGTYFEIPRPGPENDNADMRNPVSMTTVDKDSLEYNVSEAQRIEKAIINDVTGYAAEPNTEQAMNIKQVMSAFEARTAVLRDLKKNFEIAIEFVSYTMAKARYGKDFLGCYVDLGTDFYLYESQYLLDLYKTAKDSNADQSILDQLLDQYYMAKYRNSPDQLERENILKHIDPARHIDADKAVELAEKGIMDWKDAQIKINFSTFVLKFERENGSIINFGVDLDFDERIRKIKQTIYSYVKRPNNSGIFQREGSTGTSGGGSGKPAKAA